MSPLWVDVGVQRTRPTEEPSVDGPAIVVNHARHAPSLSSSLFPHARSGPRIVSLVRSKSSGGSLLALNSRSIVPLTDHGDIVNRDSGIPDRLTSRILRSIVTVWCFRSNVSARTSFRTVHA